MNYLKSLLHPMDRDEFLCLYEQNQPFVIHHKENELQILRNLPQLKSLKDLINQWPGKVSVHLPDARDEISSVEVDPKDALKLYQNGMGLLFNRANLYSEVLQEWSQGLTKELGLSSLTFARSLIYATPHGKGTAPHFDQNINLVLQIHGTKIWKLAANHSVSHPTVRHTIGRPVDEELQSYLEEELPLKMPDETVTFELKPGSLLFVPRGIWHSTQAEGDALALNFTFSPPTWADLFLSALKGRLNSVAQWRETALGVSDPELRFDAEKKFDFLLSTLIHDIPNWRADEILNVTELEHD